MLPFFSLCMSTGRVKVHSFFIAIRMKGHLICDYSGRQFASANQACSSVKLFLYNLPVPVMAFGRVPLTSVPLTSLVRALSSIQRKLLSNII